MGEAKIRVRTSADACWSIARRAAVATPFVAVDRQIATSHDRSSWPTMTSSIQVEW